MTEQRVRELAEELAQKLESDESLDEDAKAALSALHDDVVRALAGSEALPSAHAHGFVERFEEKHPDLTAFVQRLAEALMNAGL